MADVNQDEIQQVRAKAQELKAKVSADPQLAQQLKDSPAETLKAQGFPDAAIANIMQGSGIQPDVAGYDVGVCDQSASTYCISSNETYVICTDTSTCVNTVYYN